MPEPLITRLFRAIRLPRQRRQAVNEVDGAPTRVPPGELLYGAAENTLYIGQEDGTVVAVGGGGGGNSPYVETANTFPWDQTVYTIAPVHGAHTASGFGAVISGGAYNVATGTYSVVSGGVYNTASNYYANIKGGVFNSASNTYAVVGGGISNVASGIRGVVGGGGNNIAEGEASAVLGGTNNQANDDYAVIGGGQSNRVEGAHSGVLGGNLNMADGAYSIVGGGRLNTASGYASGVLGGAYNDTANYSYAHILGQHITADAADTTFVNNLKLAGVPGQNNGPRVGGTVTFLDDSTLTTAADLLKSQPEGISGAVAIANIVKIAQADYDALVSKDETTLYIIDG